MSYHVGNRGELEREERRKGRRKEDEKAKKEKYVRKKDLLRLASTPIK